MSVDDVTGVVASARAPVRLTDLVEQKLNASARVPADFCISLQRRT